MSPPRARQSSLSGVVSAVGPDRAGRHPLAGIRSGQGCSWQGASWFRPRPAVLRRAWCGSVRPHPQTVRNGPAGLRPVAPPPAPLVRPLSVGTGPSEARPPPLSAKPQAHLIHRLAQGLKGAALRLAVSSPTPPVSAGRQHASAGSPPFRRPSLCWGPSPLLPALSAAFATSAPSPASAGRQPLPDHGCVHPVKRSGLRRPQA